MSDAPDRHLRAVEQPDATTVEEMKLLSKRVDAWDQDTETSKVLAKAGRWRLGYLGTQETNEGGKSQRQLATEIGMVHNVLGRYIRIWKDHSGTLGSHLIELIQMPRSEGISSDACSELALLPDIKELYEEVRDRPKARKEKPVGTPEVVAIDGTRRLGPGKLKVPGPGTLREKIASEFIIAGPDGLTGDELIASGVVSHASAGRISELVDADIVYATNTYRTTRSGRKATVSALTPEAAKQAGLTDYEAPAKKKRERSGTASRGGGGGGGGGGTTRRSRTPKSQLQPTPEEEAATQKQNYFHECRMTLYRAVLTFKGADAPDPDELGLFLADGSPGFGPFELQKTVQYLQKLSAAYSQHRGIDPDTKGDQT